MARYPRTANPELAKAMRQLRSSSSASPHLDRHAQARAGAGKGGRAGGRRSAISQDW